jgi:hypothetical protein
MRRSMIFALPMVLASTLLGGCSNLSGMGLSASYDDFVFTSDAMSPKTVSLVDIRTKQTVWSMEVPVGQQIKISFTAGTDPKVYMPDTMRVTEGKANTNRREFLTRIPCPGPESRRLEWSLRSVPEIAGDKPATGASAPVSPTKASPSKSEGTKVEPSKTEPTKPKMIDLPETEAPKNGPK